MLQGSEGVREPKAHTVADRAPDQRPFPIVTGHKNLREMKDHQQTVGEMMKHRAVPVWHLQTEKIKTSSLCCNCEEQLGVKGDVGPEAAHRISRGVIRQQPAGNKQQED